MPSNTERIAKNTILLYFRQILSMLVSLYTVRIVLSVLGTEDYGIYNIAGGLVVMFTFLKEAMTSATQRFLNFSMGQNNMEQARNVFSISFILYILFAIFFIILAQSIGLLVFNKLLNIPPNRQNAALIVYHFSVAKVAINILQVPYRATIIAYEKMSFYATISIIEVLLKLSVAFLLATVLYDKLVFYSFLVFIVEIIVFFIKIIYCNKNFIIANFRFCKDKQLFHQLAEFSVWSVFPALSNKGNSHGTNILINIFYGVTVNAAMGIAMQVNTAVYSFVSNFQTAFRPQITKSYAAKDYHYFFRLVFLTSKVSFFLLFFLVLPLYVNVNFVLQLWLKNIPEYTALFTRLILLYSLLSALSGPLWMSIHATGDIKKYELIGSCFVFANLPLSFLFLWLGYEPVCVLIIKLILNFFLFIWRFLYISKKNIFPVTLFLREVIIPISIIAGAAGFITVVLHGLFVGINALVLSCIVSTLCIALLAYFVGLNTREKASLQNWVKKIIL